MVQVVKHLLTNRALSLNPRNKKEKDYKGI
jgi:hypothetical protein